MENELAVLEDKINALARLCQRLRLDNLNLRQSLTDRALENEALERKLQGAMTRVEAIINTLPEDV